VRWITTCIAAVLVMAILAFWGVNALTSRTPDVQARPDEPTVGIMKMMQEAKDLPEHRFDAF
jgi:hypothetical protein